MESRIEVIPIYSKERHTEAEIRSFKLKCNYLQWFFKSRYESSQHIKVEIMLRHYKVNNKINDVLVKCKEDRKHEDNFHDWVHSQKHLWKFILHPSVNVKADLSILVEGVAQIKPLQNGACLVTRMADKTEVEWENYEDALNEFINCIDLEDF